MANQEPEARIGPVCTNVPIMEPSNCLDLTSENLTYWFLLVNKGDILCTGFMGVLFPDSLLRTSKPKI